MFNFSQAVSVATSTTLPPLPVHRDVLTQTDFRSLASVSASPGRQYRLSPKSRRAPPPPCCPPPAFPTAPPVPPPPPSRSPLQIHEYLDNPSSFSYYTSPISTLNLDSSFTFSTLSSDQSRYYRTTNNYIRSKKVRKRKAPSPPIKKPTDNVITEIKEFLDVSCLEPRLATLSSSRQKLSSGSRTRQYRWPMPRR